jgi:hypothetical protein
VVVIRKDTLPQDVKNKKAKKIRKAKSKENFHKLTTPFSPLGTTPSLTQSAYDPARFAIMTSVVSLSPTTATCSGLVTPVSGCARKYSMISAPQPGFLVECASTVTPVAASTARA